MKQSPLRGDSNKLDQLTALRFFAAFMIVVHHSDGYFGITRAGLNLGQGVSFFFVLSGFILAYVYPRLETFSETKRFWLARVARIWPAYLASLALGFVLVPYVWDTATAVATVAMVQSWIPLSKYYFSYNAVAWSVSTEFFFYLAFPLLLYRWSRYWAAVTLLVALVLAAVVLVSDLLNLPEYGDPQSGSDGLLATQHGLVYINPISRIFEFVIGMFVAQLWRSNGSTLPTATPGSATLLEIGVLVICLAAMKYAETLVGELSVLLFGTWVTGSAAQWVTHSGSAFAFGLLIYVFACGQGALSRILSAPPLVLLGEISFSLYLVHQILLVVYGHHAAAFSWVPNPVKYLLFLAVLGLSSYLMWVWIEMPGRRLLLGAAGIHGTSTMRASWRHHRPASAGPIMAALALVGLLAGVRQVSNRLDTLDAQSAEALTSPAFKRYLGASVGGAFELVGLSADCRNPDIDLRIAWRKTGAGHERLINAVHIIDSAGEMLAQADYEQPVRVPAAAVGEIWLDRLVIPATSINGAAGLALGIYDRSGHSLTIEHRDTDWNGRRLVIPIDHCIAESRGKLPR